MCSQKELQDLEVKLSTTEESYEVGKAIKLKFVIENNFKKKQKVCTFYTPIEGFKGNFLKVFHENGEEVAYQGVMKKRAKPSKSDYIKIKDGKSVEHVFAVEDHYPILEAGKYKIQFIGKEYINGLPDSNILEIQVE